MYLLMHKKTRPTGRRLAAALGMEARWKTPKRNDTIAVRWGTAEHATLSAKIQPSDAIARASNKLVSFQCFSRDGVPVPDWQVRYDPVLDAGTWFGRRTNGMCGTDIVVWKDGHAILGTHAGSDFFTKFIPNKREYRIHVFKDEILGIMGKYLDFPALAGDGYIKNVAHGYRFRTPSKALKPSRTDAAIAAVKSLGLDFGAVDLLIGDDDETYVLEVNTAPALAPLTLNKYVRAIQEVLDNA